MLRRILPLALVALGAATVLVPAGPASAGTAQPGTFTVDPTSGPSGTVVALASVTACFNTNVNPQPVVAWTDSSDDTVDVPVQVDINGNWTASFEIPAGEPLGAGMFEARCQYVLNNTLNSIGTVPPGSATLFTYDPVTFTVTAPPTTTSTSTTTTPAPTVTATPSVTDGENILVSTTGWQAGSTITVTLESDPIVLGTLVADALGNATGSFPLPSGVPTGAHTLRLTGTGIAGQVQVLTAPVTVARAIAAQVTTTVPTTATPTTVFRSTLPVTGSDIATPAGIAFLLVGAGGAAMLVARRRHAR